MSKYFPAKAQEFLERKQVTMTVMDYVARFIELARFGDDYVATDMAKVRRFENGLKLSIRGKIVGLRLQDMDSMFGNSFGHRERDGGHTGHSGCKCRWEEEGGSAFFEFGKEAEDFCTTRHPGIGASQLWDSTVPVINGTGVDTVCFFSSNAGQRD